jgi:DNA-binding CsgD family transcriptional regulator
MVNSVQEDRGMSVQPTKRGMAHGVDVQNKKRRCKSSKATTKQSLFADVGKTAEAAVPATHPQEWGAALRTAVEHCLAQMNDYQVKGALPLQSQVYGLHLLKEVIEDEARHLRLRLAWPYLTNQQRTVLTLVSQHKSDREIARELCLSLLTVQTHIRNACQRLGVSGRAQAADMAMALGFIPMVL